MKVVVVHEDPKVQQAVFIGRLSAIPRKGEVFRTATDKYIVSGVGHVAVRWWIFTLHEVHITVRRQR